MKDSSPRYVIYSRKSRFTGKGNSIENQIVLCRQYIAAVSGTEAAESAVVFEDEGFSGGTLRRPQFQKMMTELKSGRFSAVVVYRLDRISRNIGDFAGLIEELGRLRVDFISIREQFDTASPLGRAMMYIASVFSQLERETIAERIRDNMLELAKTGRWLGGITPTGYASESSALLTADGKARKAFHLTPIPDELALVRCIFSVFLRTESLTAVDCYLLEHHFQSKNGRPFTRVTIKNILENPVYMTADPDAYRFFAASPAFLASGESDFDGRCGMMVYNRTIQKSGQKNEYRPISEWIAAVGQHPGLIPGKDWIAVQSVLQQNRSKTEPHSRSSSALLSGLLICSFCGSRMRAKQTSRRTSCGDFVYAYLCTKKERSRGSLCQCRNAAGNLLDDAVFSAVTALPEDKAVLFSSLAEIQNDVSGLTGENNQLLKTCQARSAQTALEIDSLVTALSRYVGTPAEAHIAEKINALHETQAQLSDTCAKLQADSPETALSPAAVKSLAETLSRPASAASYSSLTAKRRFLRSVIESVVWDGRQAVIRMRTSSADSSAADACHFSLSDTPRASDCLAVSADLSDSAAAVLQMKS